jgi:hypothetical protein
MRQWTCGFHKTQGNSWLHGVSYCVISFYKSWKTYHTDESRLQTRVFNSQNTTKSLWFHVHGPQPVNGNTMTGVWNQMEGTNQCDVAQKVTFSKGDVAGVKVCLWFCWGLIRFLFSCTRHVDSAKWHIKLTVISVNDILLAPQLETVVQAFPDSAILQWDWCAELHLLKFIFLYKRPDGSFSKVRARGWIEGRSFGEVKDCLFIVFRPDFGHHLYISFVVKRLQPKPGPRTSVRC